MCDSNGLNYMVNWEVLRMQRSECAWMLHSMYISCIVKPTYSSESKIVCIDDHCTICVCVCGGRERERLIYTGHGVKIMQLDNTWILLFLNFPKSVMIRAW